MHNPEKLFSSSDQARIAEAVKTAERATSGEIVPYVVGQSDHYPEAGLRLGALLAFLLLFAVAIYNFSTTTWLPVGMGEIAILTVLVFGVGMLLGSLVPGIKRLLLQGSIMTQRVEERASMAFLSEEVFSTRERTGIMLFLSLFERRVLVMGDSGINAKVEQHEWDGIAATITAAMKTGDPTDGLVKAIEACGTLLEQHGVAIRSDDTNELDNSLRMSDT